MEPAERQRETLLLVSWSLTSLFSTNMAISETRNIVVILTQEAAGGISPYLLDPSFKQHSIGRTLFAYDSTATVQ